MDWRVVSMLDFSENLSHLLNVWPGLGVDEHLDSCYAFKGVLANEIESTSNN